MSIPQKNVNDEPPSNSRVLEVTESSPAVVNPFVECLTEPEWLEWYLLTPEERLARSQALWPEYLALGGSMEPEIDFQSPFYSAEEYAEFNALHQARLAREL